MSSKQVLILGTAARGGIQSVIEAYNEAGFYSPGSSRFIPTHVEGGMWIRVRTASRAFAVVPSGAYSHVKFQLIVIDMFDRAYVLFERF